MVIYSDLFTFVIMLCAVITLVINIKRKKQRPRLGWIRRYLVICSPAARLHLVDSSLVKYIIQSDDKYVKQIKLKAPVLPTQEQIYRRKVKLINTSVLEKLIESKRMPVLFIGSGISKRYLYKYPNWSELLEMSFKKINSDSFQYQKHIDNLTRQGFSSFDINIKMGTIIENEFNTAFFDRKIKVGTSANPAWVKRGISPYKMFLALYFKKLRVNTSPNLQDELAKFKQLKNKISAVITTNYDLLLENVIFPSDYTVFTHQNELFSSDSYNISEIYKIHGRATDAGSIIITEKDYNNFAKSRKLIIAKMLTLFAESPIVFLGYSFTDEDVQSIILEFLECLTEKELENINEHFIFVSYKKGQQDLFEIKRTLTTQSGAEIPITEIQTDNFSAIYDILNKITPGIAPSRIRETRKLVKHIVDQSISAEQAESVIVGIDDLSNIDLSSKPLAIAIGYRESILNKYGYGLLSDEMILEDILFDNKHFDAYEMCANRFKSLAYTRLIPVFKYVKNAGFKPIPNSKLSIYIDTHNSKEKIISKSVEKSIQNLPEIKSHELLMKQLSSVDVLNKKAGLLLKNINNFDIDVIREVCKYLYKYDSIAATHSTNFKRCVMYIDLIENYPT
jgi:hypothetical protein